MTTFVAVVLSILLGATTLAAGIYSLTSGFLSREGSIVLMAFSLIGFFAAPTWLIESPTAGSNWLVAVMEASVAMLLVVWAYVVWHWKRRTK